MYRDVTQKDYAINERRSCAAFPLIASQKMDRAMCVSAHIAGRSTQWSSIDSLGTCHPLQGLTSYQGSYSWRDATQRLTGVWWAAVNILSCRRHYCSISGVYMHAIALRAPAHATPRTASGTVVLMSVHVGLARVACAVVPQLCNSPPRSTGPKSALRVRKYDTNTT